MKKIVILGANGGIGKYLVDYFCQHQSDDFEIIGVGRHPCEYLTGKIQYIEMDITKTDEFQKLPHDVYAVIDLAGAMPARMAGYNPRVYIDTNIVGTFNVLEYCVRNAVDRVLFSQSFGDIKDISERELVLRPLMKPDFKYDTDHSLYVVSKNTAVEMIRCYNQLNNLKAFIFRLPTIYSWSRNDSYYVDGILKKRAWRYIIDRAIEGKPVEVWGDPSRVKDMVYVKDFCQMLFKACFVERNFGYYNVGTGIGTPLIEQIRGIVDIFGNENKSQIIMCPEKPNAPQYIMDISNAQMELGYFPAYSYIEMLQDMKKERMLNRF